MQPETIIHFFSFHLNCTNEQLWQGSQLLPLRPKPFAVLRYLATHPNRLVTKEELLKAVWPDVRVSEGLLHTYVRDLRQVLGENPEAPRIIETVARRGYRFIAAVTAAPVPSSTFKVPRSSPPSTSDVEREPPAPLHPGTWNPKLGTSLVGRDTELAQLHGWLGKALSGERQVVFVTGEPGIGKTTLIESFLFGVRSPTSQEESQRAKVKGQKSKIRTPFPTSNTQHLTLGPWVGRGQCIEHYGSGEAYLPVLEALGRLCREPGNARLTELLDRHAPAWLVQMPGLVEEAEFASLQQRMQGVTQERMLRELSDALEVLAAERPLVLWLEDLQWSDYSTLDFLGHLARRREAARLLVLGTYRPSDVILSNHPLKGVKQELHTHRQCVELPLGCLSEAAVTQYLEARFPGSVLPARLGSILYRSTEGSPLFLVNVVDYFVAQRRVMEVEGKWELKAGGETAAGSVPESLRQMIERQIERLAPEDRQVLEVASVAGMECAAVTVATGIQAEVEKVEEQCETLARRSQFLHAAGTEHWPDGTVSARYRFIHALYQAVLYDRVAAARRVRLHRLIGERVEAAYGERAAEVAGELALHFERGQQKWQAVQYHRQAAEQATRWSAPREAIHHVQAALALLQTLPATHERMEQELCLQLALAEPLIATTGFAAPEVGATYTRAQALCQQIGEPPQFPSVLFGLMAFHLIRGELGLASAQGGRLLHLAQQGGDSTLLLLAHTALGVPAMNLGAFATAFEHLSLASSLYDPHRHHVQVTVHGLDPGVLCGTYAAFSLFCLGSLNQARQKSEEALALAHGLSHPYSTALALTWAAAMYLLRREIGAAQQHTQALIALAQEQEFPYWLGFGLVLQGWALAVQGDRATGSEHIHQGLAILHSTGTVVGLRFCAGLQAEVYGRNGKIEEALATVNEVLRTLDQPGERLWDAELYRLKGELTLQQWKIKNEKLKITAIKGKGQKKSSVVSAQLSVPNAQHLTPSTQEAETCFLKAIEIAQKQQAKTWELRATMSLARLWQQQGKHDEAWQMLSAVYNWFTEGFDTKDLQEAKALLDSLGSSV